MEKLIVDDVCRALKILGVPLRTIDYIASASTDDAAVRRWREVFPELKALWKRLAFELHPDRHGGSSEAFVEVRRAWEIVSGDGFPLALRHAAQRARDAQAPAPVMRVVVYTGTTVWWSFTLATSSVTSTGLGSEVPFFVRRI